MIMEKRTQYAVFELLECVSVSDDSDDSAAAAPQVLNSFAL